MNSRSSANNSPDVRDEATPNDILWMEKYRKLEAFRAACGHCNVTFSFEDKKLVSWVGKQRELQKAGKLQSDREQLLNDLGFNWGHKQLPWIERYNKLAEFKQKNGHFQVSLAEDRDLCFWLNGQRKLYRTGKLRKERQELLDKIEFVWTVKRGNFKPVPVARAPVIDDNAVKNNEMANTQAGSESAASSSTSNKTPAKMDQKFALGTRIEKIFKVDGVSQAFGGNVTAFEFFEDENCAKAWGYLIHYDDGDREHMLEADVEKNLVVVKSKKRVAKSAHQNSSKRVKHASASLEKKSETRQSLDVSEKPQSAVRTKKTDNNTTSSAKDGETSRSRAVTKKAPQAESNAWVSRLRDAKLDRSSGNITTPPPVASTPVARNVSVKKNETPRKRLVIHDSESDSSDDEPLHSLVRKPVQTGVKKESTAKDVQHEAAELIDGDESTADPVPTSCLCDHSSESPMSHQKFSNGTLVSRMFVDLSDNEREKSYGGKVVDYVYLKEEGDWFYFVRYDDGDTEFMDEWEVAKFSAAARS